MTFTDEMWIGMVAIVPVWIVMAAIWFGLASIPKRTAGPEMRTLIDGAAVTLSLGSALAVLVGLDCKAIITLPFTDAACHAAVLQLGAWGIY